LDLVIDASVGIKWFALEELNDEADLLHAVFERLIVPDLFFAEIANIIWKKTKNGAMSVQSAKDIMPQLQSASLRSVPSRLLGSRATELAIELGHPAYDCIYLALTELCDGLLLTADRRLLNATRQTEWERRTVHLARIQKALESLR